MGDSEELTHMLAAVAEGIAVGPGCSSLGWPFCRDVLSDVCDWWWQMLAFSQSVARTLLLGQQLAHVAQHRKLYLAIASRGWVCRQLT
jgi:hypothetical protein